MRPERSAITDRGYRAHDPDRIRSIGSGSSELSGRFSASRVDKGAAGTMRVYPLFPSSVGAISCLSGRLARSASPYPASQSPHSATTAASAERVAPPASRLPTIPVFHYPIFRILRGIVASTYIRKIKLKRNMIQNPFRQLTAMKQRGKRVSCSFNLHYQRRLRLSFRCSF